MRDRVFKTSCERQENGRGFSLIEVVLAIGIAGVVIALVLALLPSITRSSVESIDTLVATSLGDAIQLEMSRQAMLKGFGAFANEVKNAGTAKYSLVADRAGSRLHARDGNFPAVDELVRAAEQYFQIELSPYAGEPLAFTPEKAFFAAQANVLWPYRLPAQNAQGYIETNSAIRQSVQFIVVINR